MKCIHAFSQRELYFLILIFHDVRTQWEEKCSNKNINSIKNISLHFIFLSFLNTNINIFKEDSFARVCVKTFLVLSNKFFKTEHIEFLKHKYSKYSAIFQIWYFCEKHECLKLCVLNIEINVWIHYLCLWKFLIKILQKIREWLFLIFEIKYNKRKCILNSFSIFGSVEIFCLQYKNLGKLRHLND